MLIIVHNLAVPFDRRVWLQCRALRDAGYRVSVICPRGPGHRRSERLEGIDVHRYPARESAGGALGYAVEYAVGLLATAWLLGRVWRRERIDVIQACNPPDIYFVLAAPFKLAGARFVFDQHDLSPELYQARYGRGNRAVAGLLRMLERGSHRTADHVVVPNESYRRLACDRGKVEPSAVTVVRNGPDLRSLALTHARPPLRGGWRHLCCYLGVMGAQDGVDLLVEAIRQVIQVHGVEDCRFALLGYGERKEWLERQVREHGIAEWVTFTGRVGDREICDYLSTADIGLAPEPPNPFNDRSTIVKVMEYMTFGLPVVAFDLPETRFSAGDAGVYADGGAAGFARLIVDLLADPDQRARRGRIGRRRIEEHLAWEHQRRRYLHVMDGQVAGGPHRPGLTVEGTGDAAAASW